VTEKKGRKVSRRDLFGIFGRGAKGFRDAIEKAAPSLQPGARPASGPVRRTRPAHETVEALLEEPGHWGIDLRRRPLGVLRSFRVTGEGLAEPLLLARVHETHYAVVAGECAADGSDLLWLAFEDRVACPACGSRWRLDGRYVSGPAEGDLASFLAEETGGILRIRVRGA
jgi:hypothetical protein